jgi:protein-tyrosine phosphatase
MKTDLYHLNGPWPGKLAIAPRPRGGDWLEDEVRVWKSEGIDVVASTLEADEAAELDLSAEESTCRANGVEFVAYPIPDRGVPASAQQTAAVVQLLEQKLATGQSIVVHCRQGIGRSSMLAACLLASAGQDVEAAFAAIARARGRPVPDTEAQEDWVKGFIKQLGSAAKH